jgi:riboflavin kinase/FMN adenylyltransferase
MKKKIFALGFFDGVHLGHQALLQQCVSLAESQDAVAAAITFLQHPQALFLKQPPLLLTSDKDREFLLRRYDIGPIYKFPVTKEVMSTPWQDFLEELLTYGAAGFVCGYDFRFGHKGEGNTQTLQQFCRELGLPCVIVQQQSLDGIRISSTHIRSLIEQGDVETAAAFLGHPHILSGEVVSGRQIGRTIGVPTANLLIPEDVVVPRLGVYACLCEIDSRKYPAVTNIGSRPTVGGHQVRAESWILDFDGDLYGQTITLEFMKFLRPEQKFDSLEELKAQIHRDAAETYRLLR